MTPRPGMVIGGIAIPLQSHSRGSIARRLAGGSYVRVADTPENRATMAGLPGNLGDRIIWTAATGAAGEQVAS